MADSLTYIPDNQVNNMLPWMLAGNGGLGGFGGGWGTGIFGFILGALVGNNGLGGLFGGNAGMGGAGYVANALNNDTGRELIIQAVNGNHEALTNLSNILHSDVASVQSALNTISLGIQNVGSQVGLSGQQVINAIQSGNAALASQLCQCCCENRLLTTEQGYQSQIRTIEQTNQLGSQADRNTASIVGAINGLHTDMTREFCDVKEREMQAEINRQAEIITQLRNEADNARQTSAFAAMLAPINTKLAEIESKQPNTVPVQWPSLTAVNTTPYVNGGFYGNAWGFGNGVSF